MEIRKVSETKERNEEMKRLTGNEINNVLYVSINK